LTPQDEYRSFQHQDHQKNYFDQIDIQDLLSLDLDVALLSHLNQPDHINQQQIVNQLNHVHQPDHVNQANNFAQQNDHIQTISYQESNNIYQEDNTLDSYLSYQTNLIPESLDSYQSNSPCQSIDSNQSELSQESIDSYLTVGELNTHDSNKLTEFEQFGNFDQEINLLSYSSDNQTTNENGQFLFSISVGNFDVPITVFQENNLDRESENPTPNKPKTSVTAQLINKEKCKLYREAKKVQDIKMLEELEKELKKNKSLKIRFKQMEEKVTKFKQIVIKMAKKQECKKKEYLSDEIMNYLLG